MADIGACKALLRLPAKSLAWLLYASIGPHVKQSIMAVFLGMGVLLLLLQIAEVAAAPQKQVENSGKTTAKKTAVANDSKKNAVQNDGIFAQAKKNLEDFKKNYKSILKTLAWGIGTPIVIFFLIFLGSLDDRKPRPEEQVKKKDVPFTERPLGGFHITEAMLLEDKYDDPVYKKNCTNY